MKCPACDEDVSPDMENMEVGDVIDCPECNVSLEIITLQPLTVKEYDLDADFEEEEDEENDES